MSDLNIDISEDDLSDLYYSDIDGDENIDYDYLNEEDDEDEISE